jgi:hypothetical protein
MHTSTAEAHKTLENAMARLPLDLAEKIQAAATE